MTGHAYTSEVLDLVGSSYLFATHTHLDARLHHRRTRWLRRYRGSYWRCHHCGLVWPPGGEPGYPCSTMTKLDA